MIGFGFIIGAAGCSRADKQLSAGAANYSFPADEVFTFTDPSEGHPYARIRPRGQNFDLVYSDFARNTHNLQGAGTPLVTHVNDHPSDAFYALKSKTGAIVVCRDPQPFYGCGMQVNDDGVVWSVIFDRDNVEQSDDIRNSALDALKIYRARNDSHH